jgi:hypothetical protein
MDLDAATFETKNQAARKLLKGVEELHSYVEGTASSFPTMGSAIETGKG